jgi:hypothetical protein
MNYGRAEKEGIEKQIMTGEIKMKKRIVLTCVLLVASQTI